ncbi:MAG: hypothetical protein IK076_00095 [Bacteroidales bacterium]|nr:hypothetical protein [Bacteroidales bacterium]
MEIIYHERRPNYLATIKSLNAGEEITFPWKDINEPGQIRTICSKVTGTFTVNKVEAGMKVTRIA